MVKLLDETGTFKYNQLKGVISPAVSCNVNSVASAYEIKCKTDKCWGSISNYHKELSRGPDKFLYFMRREPCILEYYKLFSPADFNKWNTDKTRDKDLYSDNSIPANEFLKLLALGFNMFMNLYSGDRYDTYCRSMEMDSYDTIIKTLDTGSPMIASFDLNGFGHIMTIMGYSTDKGNEGIYVYDSYGMKYLTNHKRHDKNKNAIFIPKAEFIKICKPKNEEKKRVLVF